MKPVVLLIPGMLNDERVWQFVTDALAGEVEVRIADVCTQDSIARMREDAWAKVADVPPEVPLVVAGFSMGGYVTLDMLAHRTRPLQGVLLVSTSALPESESGRAGREKALAAMAKDFPRFVEGLLSVLTHVADASLTAFLRRIMLEVGADTAARQMRAIMGRQDHRVVLAGLDLPVAVLCGRQDRVTPPALSETLAKAIARAQLELIEDTGHMLPCERPQVVAQALRQLITHNN